MYLFQYFSDVLPLMYAFPYYYSALTALHTVLHVDTVLVAIALMIIMLLGPSPGLGRHSWYQSSRFAHCGLGTIKRSISRTAHVPMPSNVIKKFIDQVLIKSSSSCSGTYG